MTWQAERISRRKEENERKKKEQMKRKERDMPRARSQAATGQTDIRSREGKLCRC